jgi:signal transduction histidine kinase
MNKTNAKAWLSWAFIGLLALLCGVLAVLQNHWISDFSRAEKQRLQQQLQTELGHLSREFNDEISRACSRLLPSSSQIEELGRERAYRAQYARQRESNDNIFSRIALVIPEGDSLVFSNLDFDTGQFSRADWPAAWISVRDQMIGRLHGGGPGPMMPPESTLIEIPRFGRPGLIPGEQEWLIAELNLDFVRNTLLPELLRRHLGEGGKLDYQAEVVSSADPSRVIFQSGLGKEGRITGEPDASVSLFDAGGFMIRFRPGDRGPGRPGPRPPGPLPRGPVPRLESAQGPLPPPVPPGTNGPGRWRLLVRHQGGSLDAVVARARWQNIAVSGAILILILATVAALVRFSRRSQQLAEIQMNFVAGVSHELRTPLTVIRTASFNLRDELARRPEQVERYGRLIHDESTKLTNLVEQILRFASAGAGHVIREREPIEIETLIDETLRSSQAAHQGAGLIVQRQLEPDLPLVLADKLAMKHAFQNLVDNALKYGTEQNSWIGVFASAVRDENGQAVEVRVADHGPGIPQEEQQRIFDPFFRGQRALKDQVHGTGLGLNLVKRIVEAHGGTIRVNSQPAKGTEFVVRIPALANGATG